MQRLLRVDADHVQRFAQRVEGVAHQKGLCIVGHALANGVVADGFNELRQRLGVFLGQVGGDEDGGFHAGIFLKNGLNNAKSVRAAY